MASEIKVTWSLLRFFIVPIFTTPPSKVPDCVWVALSDNFIGFCSTEPVREKGAACGLRLTAPTLSTGDSDNLLLQSREWDLASVKELLNRSVFVKQKLRRRRKMAMST